MRALDRRLRSQLLLIIALGVAQQARAQYASDDLSFGELDVTVLHGYPRSANGYYGPITIGLELRAPRGERSVRIEIDSDSFSARTLRLPRGELRRVFFYLPSAIAYRDGMPTVRIVDLTSGKQVSRTVTSPVARGDAIARLGPLTTALNVEAPYSLVGALDAHLPDHWQGLSGLSIIVLEHGWAATHPIDWSVLLDWVALGGTLIVSTPEAELAAPLQWARRSPLTRTDPGSSTGIVQHLGLGAIARLPPEQLRTIRGNFAQAIGACQSCKSAEATEIQQELGPRRASERLQGVIKPPGWALFSLLGTFAIVVGPVGFAVFLRRKPRPFAYVAFALITGAAFSFTLFGADLIQNGVRMKCIANSLIFVDQRLGAEIGFEDAALYAPMNTGLSLSLGQRAQLLLDPAQGFGHIHDPLRVQSEGTRERIEDAIAVRQATELGVRWKAAARGQLIVTEADGGVWAENQLGLALHDLLIWHHGRVFACARLSAGQRVRLQPPGASKPVASSPPGGLIGRAAELFAAIASGQRGEDRYAASYAWTPSGSTLGLHAEVVKVGQHMIAGVY